MGEKRLPELPDLPETGRMYVDRTRGGWLASPGVERHVFPRPRPPAALILLAAVVLIVALGLLAYWRL